MTMTTSDPPTQPHEAATIRVRGEADDIVSLYLRGEFDAFNASEITHHALRALAAEKHLVLDLSDTTFIDASVIGALARFTPQPSDRGRSAVPGALTPNGTGAEVRDLDPTHPCLKTQSTTSL